MSNLRLLLILILIAGAMIVIKSTDRNPIETQATPLAVDKKTLADAAVQSQYRTAASLELIKYRHQAMAGSGFAGHRDGAALFAQFVEPHDICLSDDGLTLYVLDGKSLRAIETRTRVVYAPPEAAVVERFLGNEPKKDLLKRKLIYSRMLCEEGTFYLADRNIARAVKISDGKITKILDEDSLLEGSRATDIGIINGALAILDKAQRRLYYNPDEKTDSWRLLIDTLDKHYKYFSSIDNRIYFIAPDTQSQGVIYDLNEKRFIQHFQIAAQIAGITTTNDTSMIYAFDDHRVGFAQKTKPAIWRVLPFSNVRGYALSKHKNQLFNYPENIDFDFKYPTNIVSNIDRLVPARSDFSFYILDKANKRIVSSQTASDTVYDKGLPGRANSNNLVGPEYTSNKPPGTNRIFWMSMSIFWDPSLPFSFGNVEVGAPRRLQRKLNDNTAAKWEIMNFGLYGTNIYTEAYDMLKKQIANYSTDYVFFVFSLQDFYYFIQFNGLHFPALYDENGVPVGIDASMNEVPVFERNYAKELQPLFNHLKIHHQDQFNKKGFMKAGRFPQIWEKDPVFRNEIIELYKHWLTALKDYCEKNGVAFKAFLVPTINFVDYSQWNIPGFTSNDKRYSVDVFHESILGKLIEAGIEAYDISYDMLRRREIQLPFTLRGINSHHYTSHFHQAIAESIYDVTKRYSLLADFPLKPSYSPKGDFGKSNNKPGNVIFSYKEGLLYMVHDLYNAKGEGTPESRVAKYNEIDYLKMALEDINVFSERNKSRVGKVNKFVVQFVYLRERDEYNEPDLGSMESIRKVTILPNGLGKAADIVKRGAGNDMSELDGSVTSSP